MLNLSNFAMKLSTQQEEALKNYVMQNYNMNRSMTLTRLKEMIGINIKNNQLFGLELLKIAHFNQEEFALMIGIDLILMAIIQLISINLVS